MAIFTPKSKFMNMMKTTLDTNRYFVENNMQNKNESFIKESSIEKDIPIKSETIKINNDYSSRIGIADFPSTDVVNEKYEEFKSFSEQQIKLNKQTKNNFDRLNKKITHNTDKIIEKSSELKYSIIKSIKDSDSFVEQKLIITEQNIDKVMCEIIDSKIDRLKVLIGINTLINIALFAYLAFCIIK